MDFLYRAKNIAILLFVGLQLNGMNIIDETEFVSPITNCSDAKPFIGHVVVYGTAFPGREQGVQKKDCIQYGFLAKEQRYDGSFVYNLYPLNKRCRDRALFVENKENNRLLFLRHLETSEGKQLYALIQKCVIDLNQKLHRQNILSALFPYVTLPVEEKNRDLLEAIEKRAELKGVL